MKPAFGLFVAERGRSEAVFLGADLGVGSGNQIFNQIMDRHLSPTDENFAWLSRRKSLEKEKKPLLTAIKRGKHSAGASDTLPNTVTTNKALPSLETVVKVAPAGKKIREVFFVSENHHKSC